MADEVKISKSWEYEQMKRILFHNFDIAVKTNVDNFRKLRKDEKDDGKRANYFSSGGAEFALRNLIQDMCLENEYFEYLKSTYLGDELDDKIDMAKNEFQNLM